MTETLLQLQEFPTRCKRRRKIDSVEGGQLEEQIAAAMRKTAQNFVPIENRVMEVTDVHDVMSFTSLNCLDIADKPKRRCTSIAEPMIAAVNSFSVISFLLLVFPSNLPSAKLRSSASPRLYPIVCVFNAEWRRCGESRRASKDP